MSSSARVKAACGVVAASVALPVTMFVAPAQAASSTVSGVSVSALAGSPSKAATKTKCKKGKKGKKCRRAKLAKKRRAENRIPLETKLLNASDLGSGWVTRTVSDSQRSEALGSVSVSPAKCLPTDSSLPGAKKSKDRAFTEGESNVSAGLGQTVGRFRTKKAAKSSMAQLETQAAACGSIVVTTEYGPVNVTVKRTSSPKFGHQTIAYKLTATHLFANGEAYAVAIRKGRFATAVVFGELGTASKAFTLRMASKAADRL